MSLTICGFEVELKDAQLPEAETAGPYTPFNPSIETLPTGYQRQPGFAQITVETLWEKDVALRMRDGTRIRCDIFRPVNDEKVPAIICWSPYGKGSTGVHGLHMVEGRFGVPQERLSGFEKFEGLDPADWTAKGYAIVNVDLRGTWDSEGIIPWLGSQDGRDGHDAIEEVANFPWCTGRVAMAGNSWLAMSQWFIAAEKPKHLVCFAPWEGASDFYRDTLCRGGVPYPYHLLWNVLLSSWTGRGKAEDVIKMLQKYPLYNDYWDDKRAKLERIDVPAYVLASYSTSLHTSGSIRGYNEISSPKKWLRIHPRQEWSDLYSQEGTTDLAKFFDFYLKGIQNGWESTAPVRVSLLTFNQEPIENVESVAYPVPEAKQTKLYLNAGGQLDVDPPEQMRTNSYNSEIIPKGLDNDSEELVFSHKFEKTTWLVGYSRAVLYMSSEIADDMDVFVQLRKLDKSGTILQQMNVPISKLVPPRSSPQDVPNSCFLKYLGPTGQLRASHVVSKIVSDKNDGWPEYSNVSREAIQAGRTVRLEVPIWPAGIAFEAGESLALKVSGHYMSMMELEGLVEATYTSNKGRHNVHYGGGEASYIEVPLTEPF